MFGLVGWQVKLAEFVVAAFLCFGAYKYIGHEAVENYKERVAGAQAKADKEKQDKYNLVSQNYESLKLERAAGAKIVEHTTERIISKEPVIYSSVCISSDGMLDINSAIEGKPTGQFDSTVQSIK